MGGTWGAWKFFTKLCVICVRSVGSLIHSFDQQYRRGACATFIRRRQTNRRSWMNVRKSLGGNWCDGGSFHCEIKFRPHNWTSSCVGQNLQLGSVPPSVFIVCVCYLHTLTCTYLHTCVLCDLKSEAVTRSYRNLCFSFYEGEPNENHKKCEENRSPTAWASNVFGEVEDKGPHRYCGLVRVLDVEESQYVVYLTA
jgi:hypothetical protein